MIKIIAAYVFIAIWFLHLAVGAGAGWAAVRLWYFRHHPLMGKVGLCLLGLALDVLTASALVFVARGVVFTWRFSTVLFGGTLISSILRVPLILYIIRGVAADRDEVVKKTTSGELDPQFWLSSVRRIVRKESTRQQKYRGRRR